MLIWPIIKVVVVVVSVEQQMSDQQKTRYRILLAVFCASLFSSPSIAEGLPNLWSAPAPPPQSLHAEQQHIEGITLRYVTLNPINFDHDKALLNREGQLSLQAAVDFLSHRPGLRRIIIEGHTDSRGYVRYNRDLSNRRAAIVRSYLTVSGIDPDLIASTGQGEIYPANDNSTYEGRQRNRKVSIHAVYYSQ